MKRNLKIGITKIHSMFTEIFGFGRIAAVIAILLIVVVVAFSVFWFIYSAPPHTFVITSGTEGSVFRMSAERYAKILARNGVTLKILPSEGSLENLKRLIDPKYSVDIGLVQGGVTSGLDIDKLVSLGSVFYEPMLLFYRGPKPITLLSQLSGKRVVIGPVGSGRRILALALLAVNGIEPGGSTSLLDLEADDSAKALLEGKVDAVFLTGESAPIQVMRTLLRTPGINLFDFTQADGYVRRIHYLSKMELPKGSIDFGKNIPNHDVQLIGPTIEIISRPDLHPALSDLLLEAAREVHGNASLFRRQGEFPAPLEHEFPISADASRFYKSGKSFFYRTLPFWMASLVSRILVVFVPIVVLLIPGLKIIPAIYRWRINLGIYRWYRALLMVEQNLVGQITSEKREELIEKLNLIEQAVNTMKVPASFADQLYGLRGNINFVRGRIRDRI